MIHKEEAMVFFFSYPNEDKWEYKWWDSLLDDILVIASLYFELTLCRKRTKKLTRTLHPSALLTSLLLSCPFYR